MIIISNENSSNSMNHTNHNNDIMKYDSIIDGDKKKRSH